MCGSSAVISQCAPAGDSQSPDDLVSHASNTRSGGASKRREISSENDEAFVAWLNNPIEAASTAGLITSRENSSNEGLVVVSALRGSAGPARTAAGSVAIPILHAPTEPGSTALGNTCIA